MDSAMQLHVGWISPLATQVSMTSCLKVLTDTMSMQIHRYPYMNGTRVKVPQLERVAQALLPFHKLTDNFPKTLNELEIY